MTTFLRAFLKSINFTYGDGVYLMTSGTENPQSPRSPDYQVEIIKAYKKIGKREETLQEVKRLLKTYGK
ncbi:MAG: hypothetical protein ACPGVO_06825, partial [Spirulinaceae cyanobacterium]